MARGLMTGLILVVAFGLLVAEGEETYDLKLKFKKEEVNHYKLKGAVETDQGGMAATQSNEQVLRVETTDVGEDGKASMKMHVLKMVHKAETMMGKQSFDSEKGESKGLNETTEKIFKAVLDSEFTFKIAPNGEMSELKGFGKMAKILKEAGLTEEQAKEFAERDGGQVMSALNVLPSRPVKIGDRWDHKTKGTGGVMTWEATLREVVEEEGHKIGVIALKLKSVEFGGVFKRVMAMWQKMGMKVTDKSEGKGEARFDITAGRALGVTNKVVITLEIGGGAAGAPAQTVKIDAKSSVELMKEAPKIVRPEKREQPTPVTPNPREEKVQPKPDEPVKKPDGS